jgi:MFS family permease
MSATPTAATMRANLRTLPRDAWVLFAGTFVNRLGTFVLPFVTLYLTHRGNSVAQAGLGLAGYGLGAVGAQAGGGLLADRLGRRNAIALSMFGGAGLTLSLVWIHGLWGIVVIVAVLGFVAELYRPASSALIADLIPSERRVAAFSAYRLMLNIGWAVGLALGGILAAHSFTLLFVGDALTSGAFGVIALVALPHGTRTAKHEERNVATARSSMLADRGFLFFLAAVFVTAAVYMQNASTLAIHVKETLGYPITTYAYLQAMNGVLVVLFELPISSWTQHRSRTHMVALGGLFVGLGFATLVVFHSVPGLMVMIGIWTFGEIVESPSTSAFVADRAPEHQRGRYQGALGMMYAGAAVMGPIIGTNVYGVSPNALWVGCGAVGVVGALCALRAGRYPAPSGRSGAIPEVDARPGSE